VSGGPQASVASGRGPGRGSWFGVPGGWGRDWPGRPAAVPAVAGAASVQDFPQADTPPGGCGDLCGSLCAGRRSVAVGIYGSKSVVAVAAAGC